MRISDWSSDVCSSDLVKSTFSLRSSVIDIEAMMASYLRACRAGMMPSQSWVISSHSTFISSQSALAMSMSKPTRLPSGLTSRSEEHTSELQSLMRISYSVLCLNTQHTTLKITTFFTLT